MRTAPKEGLGAAHNAEIAKAVTQKNFNMLSSIIRDAEDKDLACEVIVNTIYEIGNGAGIFVDEWLNQMLDDVDNNADVLKTLISYTYHNQAKGERFWYSRTRKKIIFVDKNGDIVEFNSNIDVVPKGVQGTGERFISSLREYTVLSGINKGQVLLNEGETGIPVSDKNDIGPADKSRQISETLNASSAEYLEKEGPEKILYYMQNLLMQISEFAQDAFLMMQIAKQRKIDISLESNQDINKLAPQGEFEKQLININGVIASMLSKVGIEVTQDTLMDFTTKKGIRLITEDKWEVVEADSPERVLQYIKKLGQQITMLAQNMQIMIMMAKEIGMDVSDLSKDKDLANFAPSGEYGQQLRHIRSVLLDIQKELTNQGVLVNYEELQDFARSKGIQNQIHKLRR